MLVLCVLYDLTLRLSCRGKAGARRYGIFMMLCGLAPGVIGLIAVFRRHERSWMVWLTILPGAFVVFFLLGEFLVPH